MPHAPTEGRTIKTQAASHGCARAARRPAFMHRVVCLAAVLPCLAMAPGSVIGQWRTQTHDSVIDVERCGSSICGRIVSSDVIAAHPDLADMRNIDRMLRPRRLQNLLILDGFVQHADAAWTGGRIYNPEDGRTYRARVVPVDDNHLRVRGCIVFPVCRSQLWTRVAAGSPAARN